MASGLLAGMMPAQPGAPTPPSPACPQQVRKRQSLLSLNCWCLRSSLRHLAHPQLCHHSTCQGPQGRWQVSRPLSAFPKGWGDSGPS